MDLEGWSTRLKVFADATRVDVTDLTDRTGALRLVIGVKTGFNPQAVLEQLYRLTPLRTGDINMALRVSRNDVIEGFAVLAAAVPTG